MSQQPPPEGDEEEAPPSTPFDNPFFLPVLIWVFAIWFAYDGWFNPEMEWVRFNRYGVGFTGPLAVYFTIQAFRDPAYLAAGLFLFYALWLGYMGWIGADSSWYNDAESALLFNRYGCGAFLVAAAVAAYRGSRERVPRR
jgi:hypothetical protein